MNTERIHANEPTIQEADVLLALAKESFVSQRRLSERTGYSLGMINRCIRALIEADCLDGSMRPTARAQELFEEKRPRSAVILAAGCGMRMVPINLTTPKALIEVRGERLIERLIRQLREAGVEKITVVVGFMKDSFEYLIDEFGVELVFNPDYAAKNNIVSLDLVADRLDNAYVVPCDIWCARNPFLGLELYSWYMVSDQSDANSTVRVNRKRELVSVGEKESGNAMIGISYLLREDAEILRGNIRRLRSDGRHDDGFWELALCEKDRLLVPAKLVDAAEFVEINTFEQLREFDSDSGQLRSDALLTIARVFGCGQSEIQEISVLKKGMTNRSFLFSVRGEKYIMRIPGEGTDRLIDREEEAEVFKTISGRGLCDDPVYIDPHSGYKITKFLSGVRVCDPGDERDLERCMELLRRFHAMKLKVGHAFDIAAQIEFYETLWNGEKSVFRDYEKTKRNVLSLMSYVDGLALDRCLTHIDAVCDNFLFYTPPGEKGESLQLTDWEYAGMQDPHVDIAMFCIYALYDKRQCDRLIDIYFENACDRATRAKIYCYIAACGLLWSNWCEYKRTLGVEFGEYSLRQYRYAKEFYQYAEDMIGSLDQDREIKNGE